MRAALYIRVSTVAQAVEGYSLDAQRHTLEAYCAAHDYDITAVYIDGGISGKDIDHRPDATKMLRDVPHNKFDLIIIWALSRLTRSVADLFSINALCQNYNVGIVSVTETFDTSTPMGRAMMGMIGIFAQMEREITAERVKMAMMERAQQGKRTANHTLGYDNDGHDSVKINREEAEIVRYIFAKYIEHGSLSAVAELCNIRGYRGKRGSKFKAESIHQILTRHIYRGYYSYKGNIYKGNFEPIIDDKTFFKAQRILNRYKKHK